MIVHLQALRRRAHFSAFAATLALLLLTSCAQAQKPVRLPNYLSRLATLDDFAAMAGAPLSAKLDGARAVKLVYALREHKLHFVNSKRFRFHYNFTSDALHNREDLNEFNTLNYGDHPYREYLLATLNHYPQSSSWTLEFTSDDRPDSAQLRTMMNAISGGALFLKDSLRLLINSDHLYALESAGRLGGIPTVAPQALYQGQRQQSLNTGTAYGYLRLLPDLRSNAARVTPADIVITRGTPAVVPLCAGIVTDALQTPLSHINVLSHNRDLPAAAVPDVWQRAGLQALDGQPVRLTVTGDSVSIAPATIAEVMAFQARQGAARKPMRLALDTSIKRVLPVANFGYADRHVVGNKAAGFGELNRIAKKNPGLFKVAEGGFAIPFVFYARHLKQPVVQAAMITLDAAVAGNAPPDTVAVRLKAVRKAIKDAPLDNALEQAVLRQMQATPPYTAFRFRSSSNAEDAAGFSGAGLYDSKTGELPDQGLNSGSQPEPQPGGKSRRSAAAAIRAVWASAWNDVAWQERRAHRIDERTMMMGILCHRAFPTEMSNGVVVTRHLYRPGYPGFTVNVQAGEVSVVEPPNDTVLAEQYVSSEAKDVSPMNAGVVADYISRSSMTQGKPVLSAAQVTKLHRALYRIKTWYYYRHDRGPAGQEFDDYALDLEFKFEPDGSLYIKQVRPYR